MPAATRPASRRATAPLNRHVAPRSHDAPIDHPPSHQQQRPERTRHTPPSPRSTGSSDAVEGLWQRYREDSCPVAREALIAFYMAGHVRRVAERLRAQLPRHIDIDDLMQQGYLGLNESLDRFDPARGVRFETFSSQRVAGSMRDYLRAQDPLPRLTRARNRCVQVAIDGFKKEVGHAPTPQELRGLLDIEDRQFAQYLRDRDLPATIPFSAVGPDAGTDEADAMDSLGDVDGPGVVKQLGQKDLREWICKGLDDRDRLIVVLYYYEDMTMREIGATLGCSESRISQKMDSIHNRLKARLHRVEDQQRLAE
jgi:RNA polymerase sigma factor for flagellar operon FliA